MILSPTEALDPNPDSTYVETAEGWLYVAGVLDRHTRRCVGWAMEDTLATSLPLAALDMAFRHRQPRGRTGASFGSGRAIRQCRLPATTGCGWSAAEHEPSGQLL